MRARTKLKLTWTSVAFHIVLAMLWSFSKMYEPIIWGSWFMSFNATLATYAVAKTYKDKVFIQKELHSGD